MLIFFQLSEITVDRAMAHVKRGDMTGFATLVNAAGELSFKRNARALALASTVPSRIVQANAADMSSGHILKTLIQAEKLLDRSLVNNPYLASSYHEKALVAEMALKYTPEQYTAYHNGNPPNVRALVEKAFYYDPLHPGTRIKLAEIMAADGEGDAAYALLKDGLKWQYLGTKGMRLFETVATQALERRDIETQTAALLRIRQVYGAGKIIKEKEHAIIEKLGPLWPLIKNR